MKIMLATDGSADSMTALHTTSRLLRHEGLTSFDLVCVAPELHLPGEKAGSERRAARIRGEYEERIKGETSRILEEARDALRVEGITGRVRPESGSPAERIIQLSSEYDLTVVGAHGRLERTQPGLGPIARRVVEHSPRNVLIGRLLSAEKSFRVLVAVDGSEASDRAIEMLADRFNVADAELTLLHVVEMPWIGLGLERDWIEIREMEETPDPETQIESSVLKEAESVVEAARRRLEQQGLSATPMVADGIPAQEILSEADEGDYDLIVLGASGRSDMKHAMLGSVSSRVGFDAPCSVLIVKTGL